ncbi:MAG: tetratricopeptide repeat protein [Pirellulales bacterium]
MSPILAGIAATIACWAPLHATDYVPGDKVVATAECKIVRDGKMVGQAFPGWVYEVKRVEGNQLWVHAKTPGWIDARNVIPFDRAVVFFSKRIAADPKDRNSFRARAIVLLELGKVEEAIADFNVLIEVQPDDSTVWNDRAQARERLGHFDAAIADYTEAIALHPYAVYYHNRAMARVQKEEFGKAAEDWLTATKLRSNYYDPHRELARLYALCPDQTILDGAKAVYHAKIACELSKWQEPIDLLVLSAACMTAGDLDGAIDAATKGQSISVTTKERALLSDQLELLQKIKARQPK